MGAKTRSSSFTKQGADNGALGSECQSTAPSQSASSSPFAVVERAAVHTDRSSPNKIPPGFAFHLFKHRRLDVASEKDWRSLDALQVGRSVALGMADLAHSEALSCMNVFFGALVLTISRRLPTRSRGIRLSSQIYADGCVCRKENRRVVLRVRCFSPIQKPGKPSRNRLDHRSREADKSQSLGQSATFFFFFFSHFARILFGIIASYT